MGRAFATGARHMGRRQILAAGVLAGLTAAAAGCGDDDEPTATAPNEAVPANPAMATKTAAIPEPSVSNADQAITRLTAGNARFAAGQATHPDEGVVRRESLAAGQHPYAIIFDCADSRVSPELVFDQGLGDLFVARTAGQVVDHAVLGTLQYGVAELKIPLLVVLGHEKCGAVKATVEALEKGSADDGNDIDALVTAIKPAAQAAIDAEPADVLDTAVRNNVANIVTALGKADVLTGAVQAGGLRIVGARYDLDTGLVAFT